MRPFKARSSGVPDRIIADTGSGHDIISRASIKKSDYNRRIASETILEFHTANGIAESDSCVPFYSNAMGGSIKPHVLEDTPNFTALATGVSKKDGVSIGQHVALRPTWSGQTG